MLAGQPLSKRKVGNDSKDKVPGGDDVNLEPGRWAAEELHQVLEQLPPRDRPVLTLMYAEECSVKQTAELTA